ncbi:hypothetical protein Tco_0276307 [Tanacetum coccineum]
MQKSKSCRPTHEHRDLYDALVKSYKLDKDLFESYGKAYSLKRDCEDKDKYEDPPARSDQWLKKRKIRKDVEPSKGSKSKESKSSSSKGTKNKEVIWVTTTDQPNVEAASKFDWFKKPKRPPTPDPDWNAKKSIDFRIPQTWISKIAKAEKPPLTFDELMSTPINFSSYVINNLKIDNLTQEHLVGPAFNLLKGTCRSQVELEYHFKECYKSVTDRLDWNNLKGQEYPFDLSKPLPLIEDRGRQVVPVNYFINNDLEYLKGGISSRKYMTSTTNTKAAKYDDIQGIEDMVPSLWSPAKVAYDKYVVWESHTRVLNDNGSMDMQATGSPNMMNLKEIEVRREDQKLYKFKEGDFPRLNLHDIEDMLLLLVQKKLSNLERDVIFKLKWHCGCLPDVLSFLSGSKTFNWESKATRRSSISLGRRHSGPTSPKELYTLHTAILKKLSM